MFPVAWFAVTSGIPVEIGLRDVTPEAWLVSVSYGLPLPSSRCFRQGDPDCRFDGGRRKRSDGRHGLDLRHFAPPSRVSPGLVPIGLGFLGISACRTSSGLVSHLALSFSMLSLLCSYTVVLPRSTDSCRSTDGVS